MYHIIKATRVYSGEPYCGQSSDNNKMEFSNVDHALLAIQKLTHQNPVGWEIYNSSTWDRIYPAGNHFEPQGEDTDV